MTSPERNSGGLSDLPLFAGLDAGPVDWRADLGKGSYGEFRVEPNDDGVWTYQTGDQFQGYCGHGGGSWEAKSRQDAIEWAAVKLTLRWERIRDDTSSCCSEIHKAAARKGLEVLRRDFPSLHRKEAA